MNSPVQVVGVLSFVNRNESGDERLIDSAKDVTIPKVTMVNSLSKADPLGSVQFQGSMIERCPSFSEINVTLTL